MEDARETEASVPEETSGRAIASFLLGLLSLTTCFFLPPLPILAIVLGAGEKRGLGRAGVILGWIGIAVYAMAAVLVLLFLVAGGTGVAIGG